MFHDEFGWIEPSSFSLGGLWFRIVVYVLSYRDVFKCKEDPRSY